MSETRLEQLFWEEADGPSSAERRQRIEQLAGASPQMRARLEELETVAAALAGLDEVAPPPQLRSGVRQAVASRRAHGAATGGILGWLQPLLEARWPVRLAYAGFGALIALAGLQLRPGGQQPVDAGERSRLAGALNVPARQPVSLAFETASGMGALELSRDSDRLVASFSGGAGETLRLRLSSPDGGLRAERVEPDGATLHELSATATALELAANGPVALVVDLGPGAAAPLDLRVTASDGQVLLERRVDPDSPTFQAIRGNQQ